MPYPLKRIAQTWLCFFVLLGERLINAGHAAEPQSLSLDLPLDYQVVQRATRAEGIITILGTWPEGGAATNILEARLVGHGTSDAWLPLPGVTIDRSHFRTGLRAPAGGWYRLEVRLKHQDTVTAVGAVEHVGVGEVFVIAGQSNSANHGEERQIAKTGLVANFTGTEWKLAHDPQPGASGDGGSFVPPLGDLLAVRFNVPVGMIAAGVGATSVREWLPRGTRFPNPPTLVGNVTRLDSGEWESNGMLFEHLMARIKPRESGPRNFRAVVWHQGESDANQTDTTRTLSGERYRQFLAQLIRAARREIGWEIPWFVAQASYHTPDDPSSAEIRTAQQSLWNSGVAIEGPDSDALVGDLREGGGKGVHFSGRGLREHAVRWEAKIGPWLEQQLTVAPSPSGPTPRLVLPGENFTVAGRTAFLFLPPEAKRVTPQPWIFYAPTLPGYPDGAERWMHEQFLASGIAVAGVDVGEAYGSPASHPVFDALYRELIERRGFSSRPCLLGRSRGGLWVSSWAIAHPERVAGMIGIYPVFDFRTYPGLTNAAPAYHLTPAELTERNDQLNPIVQVGRLARAGIPVALLQGDQDGVVPLRENSGEFVRRYQAEQAGALVRLIVLSGQGHSFYEGFFHSQELVDFAIARAQAGVEIGPSK